MFVSASQTSRHAAQFWPAGTCGCRTLLLHSGRRPLGRNTWAAQEILKTAFGSFVGTGGKKNGNDLNVRTLSSVSRLQSLMLFWEWEGRVTKENQKKRKFPRLVRHGLWKKKNHCGNEASVHGTVCNCLYRLQNVVFLSKSGLGLEGHCSSHPWSKRSSSTCANLVPWHDDATRWHQSNKLLAWTPQKTANNINKKYNKRIFKKNLLIVTFGNFEP